MPQLDPANFSTQLFWLTISFVVLYVVLARFLLPRIQGIFDLRARAVESDLTQAETLKSEAERVQDEYEKTLVKARAQSDTAIAETKNKVAETANARQAELDKMVATKIAESEAGIQKAKNDVMDKLLPVARGLAENIVELVVNYKPDAKELELAMRNLSREKETVL